MYLYCAKSVWHFCYIFFLFKGWFFYAWLYFEQGIFLTIANHLRHHSHTYAVQCVHGRSSLINLSPVAGRVRRNICWSINIKIRSQLSLWNDLFQQVIDPNIMRKHSLFQIKREGKRIVKWGNSERYSISLIRQLVNTTIFFLWSERVFP